MNDKTLVDHEAAKRVAETTALCAATDHPERVNLARAYLDLASRLAAVDVVVGEMRAKVESLRDAADPLEDYRQRAALLLVALRMESLLDRLQPSAPEPVAQQRVIVGQDEHGHFKVPVFDMADSRVKRITGALADGRLVAICVLDNEEQYAAISSVLYGKPVSAATEGAVAWQYRGIDGVWHTITDERQRLERLMHAWPVRALYTRPAGVTVEAFASVSAEALDTGQLVIATLPNNSLAIYTSRADAEGGHEDNGEGGWVQERVVPVRISAVLDAGKKAEGRG